MSSTNETNDVFEIKQSEPGCYEIVELPIESPPEGDDKNFKSIDINLGILKVVGGFDTQTYGIGVKIYLAGMKLGHFSGSLKEGLVVKVNVGLARGQIKLTRENGAVYVSADLNSLIGGPLLNEKVKLF